MSCGRKAFARSSNRFSPHEPLITSHIYTTSYIFRTVARFRVRFAEATKVDGAYVYNEVVSREVSLRECTVVWKPLYYTAGWHRCKLEKTQKIYDLAVNLARINLAPARRTIRLLSRSAPHSCWMKFEGRHEFHASDPLALYTILPAQLAGKKSMMTCCSLFWRVLLYLSRNHKRTMCFLWETKEICNNSSDSIFRKMLILYSGISSFHL